MLTPAAPSPATAAPQEDSGSAPGEGSPYASGEGKSVKCGPTNAANVGALIARAERAEARIAATDKFCELQLAFAQIDDDAVRIRLLKSVRESLALDNGAEGPPALERAK